MAASRPAPAIDPDDEAYCRALLRAGDRDRYLCDLFAPEAARPALFAVHAFVAETAQIPARVSEPMLGELRFQWWRDMIDQVGGGPRIGNPVIDAVGGAITAGAVARGDLEVLLDEREVELRGETAATLARLEDNRARAGGMPVLLAARILSPGVAADAAAHEAGIALGLTAVLTGLADVRSRDTAAAHFPADLLKIHGLERIDASTEPAVIRPAVGDIAAAARHHLDRARDAIGALAPEVLPAFLPLATVEPDIARIERSPFAGRCGPLRRQWAIYRAAWRGRI